MSQETNEQESKNVEAGAEELKLNGLYAFKVGMSSVYDEKGDIVPVTVLKYEPMIVSQIKRTEDNGYNSIQLACKPKKDSRTTQAQKKHLKNAGFENGAYILREIRQDVPEGAEVGQKVSIHSFQAGDLVKLTAKSKGRGFSGVMKRHGFGGGPASHGSGFHRRPGSIGNCEFPGRVMPGRKMPGHYGDAVVTVKNLKIVEVIPEENVLLVKGAVPGSKNNLVQIVKV